MMYDDTTTCADMLAAWDSGDSVWTIEMGGLGPGYEQAIQVLAIEIVRDNLLRVLPSPDEPAGAWGDETVRRLDKACRGFSGAQVGAAKHIAYRYLSDGYGVALRKAKEQFTKNGDDDRFILVSSAWPHVPAAGATR